MEAAIRDAGAAAPGHAEQEQHQNAHRNRQERPAPVRQLIPVFQQRTAQDQIAHGVPEVVAEEIDEPEKLPFVAHMQPQPPADKILDVVEQRVAEGEDGQQNKQIPVDFAGLMLEAVQNGQEQCQKDECGQIPQMLNVADPHLGRDGHKLPEADALSPDGQHREQGNPGPDQQQHRQVQCAKHCLPEIQRPGQRKGAAGEKEQGHADAQQGNREVQRHGSQPVRQHLRRLPEGHVIEHHQIQSQNLHQIQTGDPPGSFFHRSPSLRILLHSSTQRRENQLAGGRKKCFGS